MTETTPASQYTPPQEYLPRRAQNLARRVLSLTRGQPAARVKFELVTMGDRWFLMVNDGAKVEDLGEG